MKTLTTFSLISLLGAFTIFFINCTHSKPFESSNNIDANRYKGKIDTLYQLLKQTTTENEPKINQLLNIIPSQYIDADTLHNIAKFYYDNSDFDKLYYFKQSLLYVEKELVNRKSNNESDTTLAILRNHYMLGAAHYELRHIAAAQQYLLKTDTILKNRKNDKDDYLSIRTYMLFANIADYQSNFTQAIDYLQIALSKCTDASEQADIYNHLAIIARKTKNYHQAIAYYKNALQHDPNFEGLYLNLGIAYDSLKKTDSLFYFANKAINLFHNNKDTLQLLNCYNTIAKHYTNQNKYKEAKLYYEKSSSLLSYIQLQKDFYISETYEGLSILAQANHQLEEALQLSQKSIDALLLQYPTVDILSPPSVAALQNDLISEPPHLLNVLSKKSIILSQLYQKTNIDKYKNAAFQYFELVDSLYKAFSLSYQSEEGDLNLYESSRFFYERAYRFCHYHGRQEEALHYFDAVKSIALRKQMNYKILKNKFIKDKSLLDKEAELENNVTFLKREHLKYPDSFPLKKSLIETSNELENFKTKLLEQYPNYKNATVALFTTPLNPPNTHLEMDDNQGLITYFMGQDSLYIIAQSNKGIAFFSKVISAQFESMMHTFIASYAQNERNTVEREAIFCQYSHKIYNILLAEPLEFIKKATNVNRLCIIPDGILHQLNFGILTQQPIQSWVGTKNNPIPFVMRDYAVSYELAQILWDMYKQQQQSWNIFKSNIDFSIFALSYQDSISLNGIKQKALNPLPYIKDELQNIQQIIPNAKIYSDVTNINTTKNNFLLKSQTSEIIHFSGHAYADSINPLYSGMFFSKKEHHQDNILSITDITTLNYSKSKLVVLNACETNFGKLHQQEGMLHIARAFRLAGTAAVVGTQWQVQNDVMAMMIPKFYEYLLLGQAKDMALQQTQQWYIDSQSDASPDKWAALIITGNTQKLYHKGFQISYFIGIILVLFLGITYKFIYKKRLLFRQY